MNLKVGVAQISTDPGDISGNTSKIIKKINDARKANADIIIFPELAIPGYMSLDLMLQDKFVLENKKALDEIKKHTKNILVIVGFIDQDKKRIGPDGTKVRYNSAALIYNNKIVDVVDKTLLPDYDIFFENRYFAQARKREIVSFKGLKLGVQICEDLWDENYSIKVSDELIKRGAEVLINISGSPFYLRKRFERERLIKKALGKYKVPFIYANTVGCQDGYDGELIFDGQSLVFNKQGNLIYKGKQFQEELFYTNSNDLFEKPNIEFTNEKYDEIEELYNALIFATRDYFRRSSFKKAFIGISGGIDSAVMAVLAAEALGKENVTGIYMPSHISSLGSLQDSKELTRRVGINFQVLPIKNPFFSLTKLLSNNFQGLDPDETEENLQARLRGIILMAHANKFKALVISTANKTETALGYATLYGDMCGAIAPLADISKLRVYELAAYINNKFGEKIPEEIISKVPTAELRKEQSDEESLGGPYSIISPLVDEIVEKMTPKEELYLRYPKRLVDKILNLINRNEFKRRQASPAIKVTQKAFGIGRRIPIAHKFLN